MTHTAVAKRYARALFALAQKAGRLDAVRGDLLRIRRALADSAPLEAFVLNPVVSAPARRAALAGLFRDRLDPLVYRFLLFLEQKRRLPALAAVAERFEGLCDEARGILRVQVTSAHPLSDDQRRQLRDRLGRKLGRDIRDEVDVDPALIGGFRVRAGDRVYDLSVLGGLNAFKQQALHS